MFRYSPLIKEVMNHQEHGLIFKAKSPKEIEKQIRVFLQLSSSEREGMSKKSKDLITKKFDTKTNLREIF